MSTARSARKTKEQNFASNEKTRARKYGLSYEEYLSRRDQVLCDICHQPEKARSPVEPTAVKRLAFDHCHETGIVRGMLCQSCNHALADVDDNVEILHNMIEYLERASRG